MPRPLRLPHKSQPMLSILTCWAPRAFVSQLLSSLPFALRLNHRMALFAFSCRGWADFESLALELSTLDCLRSWRNGTMRNSNAYYVTATVTVVVALCAPAVARAHSRPARKRRVRVRHRRQCDRRIRIERRPCWALLNRPWSHRRGLQRKLQRHSVSRNARFERPSKIQGH